MLAMQSSLGVPDLRLDYEYRILNARLERLPVCRRQHTLTGNAASLFDLACNLRTPGTASASRMVPAAPSPQHLALDPLSECNVNTFRSASVHKVGSREGSTIGSIEEERLRYMVAYRLEKALSSI